MTTRQEATELQDRTCRACGRTYRYPALKSLATRFHCEQCMELPPAVRATFEAYNRRIHQLSSELAQLKRRVGPPDETR